MSDFTPQISMDDDDDGMEYVNYHNDDTYHTNTAADLKESPKNKSKAKRSVRFAEAATVKEVDVNTPNSGQTPSTSKHKKNGMTMADLLGTRAKKRKSVSSPQKPDVEESVVSKAEPSWFAAWFRRSNVESGQEERAQALMHYSDLSWRRMRKVAKEVNMNSAGRDNLNVLFKKYPKGRLLATKGITLDEYDEAMRDAWISAWENMNDSLRRFGRSEHYEKYLAVNSNISIRNLMDHESTTAPENVKAIGNDGIAIRGNVIMESENGAVQNGSTRSDKSTNFPFQSGLNGKKSSQETAATNHERTSPVLM